jgi:hypothetical protein
LATRVRIVQEGVLLQLTFRSNFHHPGLEAQPPARQGFLRFDYILVVDPAMPFKLALVVNAPCRSGSPDFVPRPASSFNHCAESINRPISALSAIERGSRFSEPTNNCLLSMRNALVCRVSVCGPSVLPLNSRAALARASYSSAPARMTSRR